MRREDDRFLQRKGGRVRLREERRGDEDKGLRKRSGYETRGFSCIMLDGGEKTRERGVRCG